MLGILLLISYRTPRNKLISMTPYVVMLLLGSVIWLICVSFEFIWISLEFIIFHLPSTAQPIHIYIQFGHLIYKDCYRFKCFFLCSSYHVLYSKKFSIVRRRSTETFLHHLPGVCVRRQVSNPRHKFSQKAENRHINSRYIMLYILHLATVSYVVIRYMCQTN